MYKKLPTCFRAKCILTVVKNNNHDQFYENVVKKPLPIAIFQKMVNGNSYLVQGGTQLFFDTKLGHTLNGRILTRHNYNRGNNDPPVYYELTDKQITQLEKKTKLSKTFISDIIEHIMNGKRTMVYFKASNSLVNYTFKILDFAIVYEYSLTLQISLPLTQDIKDLIKLRKVSSGY